MVDLFYNPLSGETPEDWYARNSVAAREESTFSHALASGLPLGLIGAFGGVFPLCQYLELGVAPSLLAALCSSVPAVIGVTAGLSGISKFTAQLLLRSQYRRASERFNLACASEQFHLACAAYDSLDASVQAVFEENASGTAFEVFTRS